MGLLEKSLRVASTYRASTPGLVKALSRLEHEGKTAELRKIRITLPPQIRKDFRRRGLL
jgi:hypothetical protein